MRLTVVGARTLTLAGAICLTVTGGTRNIAAAGGAQEPSLRDVLGRAGRYVVEYQRELAGVVFEESYLQTFTPGPGALVRYRGLRSDVLLVRPPATERYVLFRDVFEIDGTIVRDRQERLTALFRDRSGTGISELRRIMEESARHNIGDIERTMNVPTLAMQFLDPANQRRFQFSRTTDAVPDTLRGMADSSDPAVARFRTSTEVWVVQYRETEGGTMIRTPTGRDLPATGRFWIEPATGRLVMSELVVADSRVRGLVDVTYEADPTLGMTVPAAMRERYVNPRTGTLVEGSAHYGSFRRFDPDSTP